MRSLFAASALALIFLVSSRSSAQRISIADPHHAYRVEGRVLLADGSPAVGLLVERATSSADLRQYSVAFWTRTDATGAFRFEFSGLGPGVGREWTLVARRPGCAEAHVNVSLQAGEMDGWDADIATGVTITLPRCSLDPPPSSGNVPSGS